MMKQTTKSQSKTTYPTPWGCLGNVGLAGSGLGLSTQSWGMYNSTGSGVRHVFIESRSSFVPIPFGWFYGNSATATAVPVPAGVLSCDLQLATIANCCSHCFCPCLQLAT